MLHVPTIRRLCQHSASARFRQLFLRHSSSLGNPSAEMVTVPCQSNGSITLSVHHPLLAPAASKTPPAVLIYLPRGPFLANPEHDAANVSVLRSYLPHHIVQIHYRLSREQQFPSPVHDVLAGYDWIHEHLLPKRVITRAGRSTHLGRVAVCGELIGGGLAAALALTECRRGQAGVVCAGLNNPVVDWVDLDELVDGEPSSRNDAASAISREAQPINGGSMDKLLQLRGMLFRKPEHYFDPFASPVLFFRSTGKAIPSSAPEKKTPKDEFEILARMNEEEFYREQHALSRVSDGSISRAPPPISDEERHVPRRASRRFPSKSSGLKLPTFHVAAGEDLLIKDQGAELIYRVRQSLAREEKAASGAKILTDEEEALDEEEESRQKQARLRKLESKAEFTLTEGKGLWDGSELGRARMSHMASWFRDQLE